MMPRLVLISLALVLAGTGGAAGASTPAGCEDTAPQEGAQYPGKPGVYVFVSVKTNDLGKIGFWAEDNEVRGLQTDDCIGGNGAYFVYERDRKLDSVVLP